MKTTSFAVAALALMAAPAFADDMMDMSKLTCAEFAAMDSEGMMKTIDMMHTASFYAAVAMDEAAMKTARACDKGLRGQPRHDGDGCHDGQDVTSAKGKQMKRGRAGFGPSAPFPLGGLGVSMPKIRGRE